METRYPIEGPFGSEFPAICNHCGVMTAWSRKTWKFCEQFSRFCGKTTAYGNIFKIMFRTAQLSVHKLFTSCIRRSIVLRDSIVDGDWLSATEWCQRHLPCCQPASKIAENSGRFFYVVSKPGNDFELIPTVEMETRNPVEGYFCSEFPAICNHCGDMAAWTHKTLTKFDKFLRFSVKTTSYGKFLKSCSKSFHRDIDGRVVVRFREIWPTREIGEIVRCLPDKKKQNFAWLYSCRCCADRVQNLPGPAPDNVLWMFQISSKSVHLRRIYSRTRERRQNAP